jgi:hypothetical protein
LKIIFSLLSVIVQIIDKDDIGTVKRKWLSPVAADPNGLMIFKVRAEWVQMISGRVHIRCHCCNIQGRQQFAKPACVFRPDSSL